MSAQTGPLAGFSVLVTRPVDQSAAFRESLRQAGARTRLLPTIEIVYPDIPPQMLAHADHNMLIFTSANAVRGAIHHSPPPWRSDSVVAAIGPATARALQANDVQVDIMPTEYNSEGMLQALSSWDLSGYRIAILRGDSGRELLFKQLQQRAKHVQHVEVYLRTLPKLSDDEIYAAVTGTNITTVSSDLGLTNLLLILPEPLLPQLRQRPLIVNSSRCADLARNNGFSASIAIASPPGDNGQLSALIEQANLHQPG